MGVGRSMGRRENPSALLAPRSPPLGHFWHRSFPPLTMLNRFSRPRVILVLPLSEKYVHKREPQLRKPVEREASFFLARLKRFLE